MLNDSKIAAYTTILQEELLLATGCTEPHRRRVLCRKAARGVGRKTGKGAG